MEVGGLARVLADIRLWGEDLSALPGLVDAVAADLEALRNRGVMNLIADISTEGR